MDPYCSLTSAAVDYNSWQESEKGLKLAARLSKDQVLAEGNGIKIVAFVCLTACRIQRV